MIRQISYSEVSTALSCMARWDFRYSDTLAGASLKPKATAPVLSEGRAWGAAVAAYHEALGHDNPYQPGVAAIEAMDKSLNEEADRQREFGVFDSETYVEHRTHLLRLLNHYIHGAGEYFQFGLRPGSIERKLLVKVPARGSDRPSSKYRLLSYLDGVREDGWLVEFKLRSRLSSAEQIAMSRQLRWYAWAYWQATGEQPPGVMTIERWNEAPKPPRILKSGKVSHAKDQLTTVEAYEAACAEHDEDPKPETADALRHRKWQQAVPITFRDGELYEAGRELAAAAHLIGELDSGAMPPIRNVRPPNCNGCEFREVCPDPIPDLIDALYETGPPKRDRSNHEERNTR